MIQQEYETGNSVEQILDQWLRAHVVRGRDLDNLVAKVVFGIGDIFRLDLPKYSSDENCSQEIVEEMRRRGWSFRLRKVDNGKWEATFENERERVACLENTATEATARAAVVTLLGEHLPWLAD